MCCFESLGLGLLHQVAQLCGLDMPRVAAEKMSSNFKTKTARAEMTQAQRPKSFYRIESKAKNAIRKRATHVSTTMPARLNLCSTSSCRTRDMIGKTIALSFKKQVDAQSHKAESIPPAAQSSAQVHLYLDPSIWNSMAKILM